jgi:hypothetical protein
MVCKGLDCGVFVIRLPVSDRRLQGLALPPQAAPFRHARQADVHLFGNLRTRIPFLEEPYQMSPVVVGVSTSSSATRLSSSIVIFFTIICALVAILSFSLVLSASYMEYIYHRYYTVA